MFCSEFQPFSRFLRDCDNAMNALKHIFLKHVYNISAVQFKVKTLQRRIGDHVLPAFL